MNKIMTLIYDEKINDEKMNMFFNLIEKARGNDSKVQYCNIFALKLIEKFSYKKAIKVMNYAIKLNVKSNFELSRLYMILGEIEEQYHKNYEKAFDYYDMWGKICTNCLGYNFNKLRCLIRINDYLYSSELESLYNMVKVEEDEINSLSREYRFYDNLTKAIMCISIGDKENAAKFIIECKSILCEEGISPLQKLLKRHGDIKDRIYIEIAKDDLRNVTRNLKSLDKKKF